MRDRWGRALLLVFLVGGEEDGFSGGVYRGIRMDRGFLPV